MRQVGAETVERDFAKKPLELAEIEAILAAAGSVAAVINRRHATAKANGWDATPPSAEDFARAALLENNLLRRPIVVRDGRAVIGFGRDALTELLK